MADWSKPSLTDPYASVLAELMARDLSSSTLSYPTDVNIPNGATRWNPATNQFEKYSSTGGNWSAWSTQLNVGTLLLGNQAAPNTMQAVPRSQADGSYAALAGNANQPFAVGQAAPNTMQAMPRSQADGSYAALAGNANQPFAVGQATQPAQTAPISQVQSGITNYAVDTSATANQISIALIPAIIQLVDGQPVRFRAANSNSGKTTITIVGATQSWTAPVVSAAGPLQGGEIAAGCIYSAVYSAATNTIVIVGAGGGALSGAPATESNQLTTLGQFNYQFGNSYAMMTWPCAGSPSGVIQCLIGTFVIVGQVGNSGVYFSFPIPFKTGMSFGSACDGGGGCDGFSISPGGTRYGTKVWSMQNGGPYANGFMSYIIWGY